MSNDRKQRYNWGQAGHVDGFTEIYCDAIDKGQPWSIIVDRFAKKYGEADQDTLHSKWQGLKKDPEFVEEYPQFSENPVGEGTPKAQVARKRYAKQSKVVEAPEIGFAEVEAPEIEFAEASPELVGLDHPKVEAMCDKQRRCNEAMRDQLKKLSDEIGIQYETLIEYVMVV